MTIFNRRSILSTLFGATTTPALIAPQQQPDPRFGAVIYWWNGYGRRDEREYEEFDSMEAALRELEEWKRKYPWNTYHVAHIAHIHVGTGVNTSMPGYHVLRADEVQVSVEIAPESDRDVLRVTLDTGNPGGVQK